MQGEKTFKIFKSLQKQKIKFYHNLLFPLASASSWKILNVFSPRISLLLPLPSSNTYMFIAITASFWLTLFFVFSMLLPKALSGCACNPICQHCCHCTKIPFPLLLHSCRQYCDKWIVGFLSPTLTLLAILHNVIALSCCHQLIGQIAIGMLSPLVDWYFKLSLSCRALSVPSPAWQQQCCSNCIWSATVMQSPLRLNDCMLLFLCSVDCCFKTFFTLLKPLLLFSNSSLSALPQVDCCATAFFLVASLPFLSLSLIRPALLWFHACCLLLWSFPIACHHCCASIHHHCIFLSM